MVLASSLGCACEEQEVPDPTRWSVDLHGADVFVYQPDPETGCLAATDERLGSATSAEVLRAGTPGTAGSQNPKQAETEFRHPKSPHPKIANITNYKTQAIIHPYFPK